MKLFSKNLSKKLQAAGCVSESGYVWCLVDWIDGKEWRPIQSLFLPKQYRVEPKENYYDYEFGIFEYKCLIERVDTRSLIQAFGWWDLSGPSERARENARILAEKLLEELATIPIVRQDGSLSKTVHPALHFQKPSDILRHALTDLKNEDEVESYILRTWKEAA